MTTTESIGKPSFIIVSDIHGFAHSINLANITKIKICDWPDAFSRTTFKSCIIIEVNQTYSIACEEKNNEGLLDFLHSLVVRDFRTKHISKEETFDEKGGIIW